jgi:hypothetical protein
MTQELLVEINVQVVDLSTPKIDGKFPLHDDQITALAEEPRGLWTKHQDPFRLRTNLDHDQSMRLFHDQREQFANSQTVIAECRSLGLGDCFNNLRYALLLAEKSPEKQVIIAVTRPISEMNLIDLPSNARMVTDYDEELLQEPNVFVIRFQLLNLLQETFATKKIPDELLLKLSQLESEGRYATYHNSLAYPYQNLANVLGLDTDGIGYNMHDLLNASRLQFLGISVDEADIRRSITLPEAKKDSPYRYDLLIVPDAGENRQDDRSVKSLSPEKWGEVFALLPSDLTIGIVMGHENPGYTRRVLEEAMNRALQVEYVTTPTLDDFCEAVMQSRKFVGGDTGPTHIARDVINAAHEMGRDISFRELFDEGRHALMEYGTIGNGGDGKVLVVNTKIPYDPELRGYDSDISNVEASTIAQFILN